MKIINRKFRREYEPVEKLEAGIVLTGAEVKAVRQGGLRLDDAHVKIVGNETQLINAEISAYKPANQQNYDPKRTRKLLLHSDEILRLLTKIRGGGGLTIVPTACYNRNGVLKLEIALAKGRKDQQKRKFDKQKKIKRDEKRQAKEYIKK